VKLGAHSWLLETQYSLPEAMSRARAIGYEGYELDIGNFGGTGLGLQILPDRLQEPQREAIRDAAEAAGIAMFSLCLGCLWHYPIAGSDEVRRARGVEIVLASIELADFLGAGCILMPTVQPEGVTDSEAWATMLKSLEPCITRAEDLGITLAIENNLQPFLQRAEQLARMVDEVSSQSFRVYYDVANTTWIRVDPVAEIHELGDRVARFHFKNRTGYRDEPETQVVSVNQPGIVPFERVVEAIRDIDYDGYFVVEVPTLGKDADAVAAENLEALQALLSPGAGGRRHHD
jgi:L-ribulose-5-phosphate 3-epimerase